jgi:hypothetical protein
MPATWRPETSASSGTASGQGCEQVPDGDPKGQRNALNVVQRDIARLPLNVGDEGPVEACLERQSVLAPALGCAQSDHVDRQQLAR